MTNLILLVILLAGILLANLLPASPIRRPKGGYYRFARLAARAERNAQIANRRANRRDWWTRPSGGVRVVCENTVTESLRR